MVKNQVVGREEIQNISVNDLLLDPKNPRLAKNGDGISQLELLRDLYNEYYLDDLIVSMARNGYFSEEPLIGVETVVGGEKKIIIVEGNRRLAAIKILINEEDRKALGITGVKEVKPEILNNLKEVPVKIYPSREDIIPYLGVRHIAGVRPWDALAKAKYIRSLVDAKWSVEDIKQMVGIEKRDVIQRWLLSLYTLNQANSIGDEQWDEAYKYFNFSLLYTALGYKNIRSHLGVKAKLLNSPRENPISKKSEQKLIDLMDDLFGRPSDPERKKIRESRDIKSLAEVYGREEALEVIKAGGKLSEAHDKTTSEAQELIDLLSRANYSLDKAVGIAPHHKEDEEVIKYAKRCFDSAKALCDIIAE